METNESYKRYHRFLSEVERKFASSIVGKSDKEKAELLELTVKIVDSFVDLYGDRAVNETLLHSARRILSEQPVNEN